MRKILVVTGEESGDKQFSLFWKEVSPYLQEDYQLWGIGGSYFESIGGEVVFEQKKLSVMGATEVLSRLPQIIKARNSIVKNERLKDTAGAILVDFPDFNFRIGKVLKKKGIPVTYFIPPKIWAWRRGRLRTMKEFVSLVLGIFPFEKEIYSDSGINFLYAGNPAVREAVGKIKKIKVKRDSLLLLPGSREFEVGKLLPEMLLAVKILYQNGYYLPVKVIVAKSVSKKVVLEIIQRSNLCEDVFVIEEDFYRHLKSGIAAIAASGTVNLELAVASVPQVVIYRVSPLTFAVGSRFVKLTHVSPVNIVAGREVVKELLQGDAKGENIARELIKFLDKKEAKNRIKKDYRKLIKDLTEWDGGDKIAVELERLWEHKHK